MNKDLIAMLKYLRLGGLLAHWDEYLKLAADKASPMRGYSRMSWRKNAESSARTLEDCGSNAPLSPSLWSSRPFPSSANPS